ncbi:MAG: PEP-CTERM sorting domain-containing protein [Gemmatimonadaceae bacterium]|nr:PEP-CTERM sorting domain-containing protein [Gemmatimonadaceae bacterium]NUO94468.1 PEP-CTERM sorting domain-containing protein [Gemmatimonadaceae bacterium]NUP54871.1 PEP-CTERM sorting domain-containing protein [Gemmatimonadaceae bacterium]NUP72375.1 PEP-CTERM sorting domain-containing protein [Gemmatimonadaceae bacterium]NUR35564.1 PEP-CTERM sorting domain-containing protein [Gemmatimonadaceae bacterium]
MIARLRIATCLGLVASLMAPPAASAQVLGVSVTGTPQTLSNPPFSLGYAFDVTNPFLVQYLGYFDAGSNGLNQSHQIGLYDPSGTLLSTVTVGPGSGDVLIGGFRMAAVTPFLLAVGAGYHVLGTSSTNVDQLLFRATKTDAYGIQYVSGAYCAGAALQNSCGVNSDGYFGANFAGVVTPEPASVVLLATGLVGILGVVRRRRSSALSA